MKVVITGGAGFVGSNLAHRLLERGVDHVVVYDNLSREGSERNLKWLKDVHGLGNRLVFVKADVRDYSKLSEVVEGAAQVYHLAAQVAVTSSVTNPRHDFEVNALGTLNVLEAIRERAADAVCIFTSTNKVYGDMSDVKVILRGDRYEYGAPEYVNGVSESRPLSFHSPYGCSKGCADQYVCDYARIYGLRTVVFRMSCQYGPRQFGNEDQGWLAHFVISAVLGRPLTIYGDGKQVRDVLFIDDLIEAFFLAAEHAGECAGKAFNIGGGGQNSFSLIELIALLERWLGKPVCISFGPWRPGDQLVYVSDIALAKRILNWSPTVSKEEGVQRLLDWVIENRRLFT